MSLAPRSFRLACSCLQGGADVLDVQTLLGHMRIETALYTRVDVSDLRAMIQRAFPRERGVK